MVELGEAADERAEQDWGLEMKIVITLVCHNRPEYLAQVLGSIRANVYHGSSLVVVRDNATTEVCKLIDDIDWISKSVYDTNLGINYANRHAYLRAIRNHDADYVVAVEDDTVMAPDCMQLVRWFTESGGGLMNCFSPSKTWMNNEPRKLRFEINFCPWVWAFKARLFADVIDPKWMRDSKGWDHSVLGVVREFGIFAVQPLLSRSQNIGRLSGVHYSEEQFDKDFKDHAMSDGKHTDYTLA